MIEIQTFNFDENVRNSIAKMNYGAKWPMVYIIEGNKEAYIGETANATVRSYQHLQNLERQKLKKITFLTNKEFNKSVALDLESFLIRYIAADGKYKLQNGNAGLQNHEYYRRAEYQKEFFELWNQLTKIGIVKNKLEKIVDTSLFKFSPYKELTDDQNIIITNILNGLIHDIEKNQLSTTLITGSAGTGKTIVAIFLTKLLVDIDRGIIPLDFDIHNLSELTKLRGNKEKLEIGLVVPTQNLRDTYRKVFKQVAGLRANMVITPSEVIKKEYDILIVDEAIRLRQRRGLAQDGYATFNRVTSKMNWEKDTPELEWILRRSKYQLLFYIDKQSIRPADINNQIIKSSLTDRVVREYKLYEQLRCLGGNDYIKYTRDLLDNKKPKEKLTFKDYEFKIFDDINDFDKQIKEMNKQFGLSRRMAGFAWPWNTKGKNLSDIKNMNLYDIGIQNNQYIWNTTDVDWIYSENAINEIGCVHTVHGYDLNYAGVIIGPDLKYDIKKKKIIVDKTCYFDIKGKTQLESEEKLFEYITNAYHILLTRGIKGTYLYICDEALRNYLKQYIDTYEI